MTDSKSLPPAKDTANQSDKSQPASQSAKTSNKAFWFFAFLTLSLIGASAGYFQYRLEMLSGANQVLKQQQSVMLNQLNSQMQQSAAQQALMEQTNQTQQALDQKLMGLNSIVQKLPGARAEDWKLAEIEYLLRLANQRVQLQQEVRGADALMKAADTILADLDDPALFIVRELIAKERLALSEAKTFDRQGVFLALQALKNQIKTSIEPPQHFVEETIPDPVSETGDEAVELSVWQQLKSLIQIRHRDQAFDAPLSQSQYQLIEHSLLLMIEQAQWALLKQEQALYQESLNNAIAWIDGKLRHSAALELQKELQKLSVLSITQTLPDVSGSLKQLRSVMDARTYRPIVPEKKNQAKPAADTSTADKKQEQA